MNYVEIPLEWSSRFAIARWAPIPLRLIVGDGFMAHGFAKLAKGPNAFAVILHAMGVPGPHVMAWLTILTLHLAEIAPACRISRARVVDAGRIVTAGGIASGMELGLPPAAPGSTTCSSRRSRESWNINARTRSIATISSLRWRRRARSRDNWMILDAIWRYPVKSMAGERLARAEITLTGVVGD